MTPLDRVALQAWRDYQDANAALHELDEFPEGEDAEIPPRVRRAMVTNATARRDLLQSVWHQREREAAGCE